MKVFKFSALILLVPLSVFSQDNNVITERSPAANLSQSNISELHIVTPLLLRESSSFHLSNNDEPLLYKNKYLSFFSSLTIPGSGQVSNRNWIKAGLFVAVEAASVYFYFDFINKAEAGEREYERWADTHWSVVQYSDWLVKYHEVNGLDNSHIDELRAMVSGTEASFNTDTDWAKINIDLLREVERETPYVTSDQERANNFSHTLPNYGSQQYYELIAKYYQYQAGWRDYYEFHNTLYDPNLRFRIDRNGAYASPYFFEGAQLANQFNTDYRRSGYLISLLIANHIFSAFDAFFTIQLKQNRLQATSSMVPAKHFTLTYSF